ncbi:tRNA (N6-isopentenyl adenosine(37)-C2)-methylthiotransferase MiaB [Botrimarina hoheduenensis]|uniref:tRNA-2-methylthio-N(6)-dimethylallyladenosine synthase n=1 Tax=Botrimarina hoheduenensis TaxID=2528000 RepID=A0A5C5W6G1_9BACT|nr:tRNA (N6-isopentenyl adenosine(37)-C2)-methylthiotransferase MiaB [Botrimarina hoheduenensis]TWT46476.1 tRNA-2-methylthio-N(6)-dimethylallyladenosine synthase [Botrimarina hoheduenensis]
MKKLYIETVGCQMNLLDSELVVASLRKEGYELTNSTADADTVLFNTCSVRQHAEDKIYSALGRLKDAKKQMPNKVIGVMGCMAQKDQRLIFQRAPYVDIVVGPGQLHQIPRLVREARENPNQQQLEVSLGRKDGAVETIKRSHESFDPLRDPTMRPTPFQAYVRIQIGCDKFCTYCIVPSVRGPEQSRPGSQIVAEVQQLADEGCKEVTLLGQTVNSWRHTEGDRTWRFSDLLHAVHEVAGIERIKFVTSYPKDMTDDVLAAVRDLPKCVKYLHVPAQHGSDTQLARMKRGYTIADYREMHDRAKKWMPNVAITSDFIVGFSGESEEDFQQTMDLVRECRFKNSFIFKYSERPGTKSADHLPDDIPDEVKRRRNNELLALQNQISEEDNQRFLGQRVQVLIEGPSKKADPNAAGPLQLTGRTLCDRIVVFEGNRRQVGQTLPVAIYDANAHTLFGAVVTDHVGPEVFSLAGVSSAE